MSSPRVHARAPPTGSRVRVFGPASARSGSTASEGIEVVADGRVDRQRGGPGRRGARQEGGLGRAGRPRRRRGAAGGDGQLRLDRGDDGRRDLRPAPAQGRAAPGARRPGRRSPANRCSSSTSAPTSRSAPSTWSSSPSSAPPSAAAVLDVDNPTVGLLTVGEEAGKGRQEVVEAHRLLSGATGIAFAGNVEGRDLPAATVDVVVTDGFTGNVALKLLEGTAKTVAAAVGDAARSNPLSARRRPAAEARASAACAASCTPTPPAARSCSACAGSPSSATAAPAPRASPTPSASPPAAPRSTRSAAPRRC